MKEHIKGDPTPHGPVEERVYSVQAHKSGKSPSVSITYLSYDTCFSYYIMPDPVTEAIKNLGRREIIQQHYREAQAKAAKEKEAAWRLRAACLEEVTNDPPKVRSSFSPSLNV